jgi:cytochrome c oxidase subunit 4
MSHDNHSSSHGNGLGHILPFNVYVSVFVALIVLTIVTVAASQVDFGSMNVVIALLIASVKAMLVALFFMHLKYENPVTWLYAAFPLIILAIMLAGLFIDNPYRALPNPVKVAAPAE